MTAGSNVFDAVGRSARNVLGRDAHRTFGRQLCVMQAGLTALACIGSNAWLSTAACGASMLGVMALTPWWSQRETGWSQYVPLGVMAVLLCAMVAVSGADSLGWATCLVLLGGMLLDVDPRRGLLLSPVAVVPVSVGLWWAGASAQDIATTTALVAAVAILFWSFAAPFWARMRELAAQTDGEALRLETATHPLKFLLEGLGEDERSGLVPTDLETLARSAVRMHAAEAQYKGLDISVVLGEHFARKVWADDEKVQQILEALIGNAIKFTARGVITIELLQEPSGHTVIEVRDTGMGLTGQEVQRLFASVDPAKSAPAIGLAACRRLAALMGGELCAESVLKVGSRFWLRLPLRRYASASGAAAEVAGAYAPPRSTAAERDAPAQMLSERLDRGAGSGVVESLGALRTVRRAPSRPVLVSDAPSGRILIVEDNTVNQKVMRQMLRHLGYESDIAANGKEGAEMAARTAYRAIMMDCDMPVMDGFQATREIRQSGGASARAPIIAATAHALAGDRDKCLACGMDDFIAKPIKREVLSDVLSRWISGQRSVA